MSRALGLVAHDLAALALVPRLYAAVRPLPVLDRSHIDFTPGLYSNDTLGDCVAVALANCARSAAIVATNADIVVDPAKVVAAFADWVGVPDDPALLANVDGVQLLKAYGLAEKNGFDVGEQVPLVPEWKRIAAEDRATLAVAMQRAAIPLGVALLQADDTHGDVVWDVGAASPPWGGHALIAWDYTGLSDTDIVRLGTWGGWQRATWRWVHARIAEAYSVAWPQLQTVA